MAKNKVVVIGGGTGLGTILRGLKTTSLDLTAIVTVADDGGSSGILREELKMLPPGDIRNVLVALAEREPLLQSLFQHRFQNGNGLAGHSVGNLLIAGMQEITGDFVTAIQALSRVLAVRGRVYPASTQSIRLKAKMEDGSIVYGESNIPKANKKIDRVYLEPDDVEALPEAILAIEKADLILFGPGSLYTSIIPNLLVQGIKEALQKSKGTKMFISNVMTQPGETDDYSVEDHIQAIHKHVYAPLFDKVVVNNGPIPREILQKYHDQGAIPVAYDKKRLEAQGIKVIEDRLFILDEFLRHDAFRLTKIVLDSLKAL
ncbi:putative cofD-like protein [Bacillus horti]|uniref:Gluconeogenesis factor n=1 Tax=Caldalkalibacillus horti TaxID=77523 RepID=A0ABT9W440_9BACI|nr:putative cofD-like protein [Bacillus horti]